jgi:hypothetical protein
MKTRSKAEQSGAKRSKAEQSGAKRSKAEQAASGRNKKFMKKFDSLQILKKYIF